MNSNSEFLLVKEKGKLGLPLVLSAYAANENKTFTVSLLICCNIHGTSWSQEWKWNQNKFPQNYTKTKWIPDVYQCL